MMDQVSFQLLLPSCGVLSIYIFLGGFFLRHPSFKHSFRVLDHCRVLQFQDQISVIMEAGNHIGTELLSILHHLTSTGFGL